MKEKLKSNSGFTLVELIIAMAILAFLMTAVSSLMGSSIMSFKKAKADVAVQTSAQETYNQLTDSIMQATEVTLVGYKLTDVDFTTNGGSYAPATAPKEVWYVKDTKQESYVNIKYGVNKDDIELFSTLSPTDKVYVKKLIINNSVAIDDVAAISGATASGGGWKLNDNLATASSATVTVMPSTTIDGSKTVYTMDETRVNTYTFEKDKLYYERSYRFDTSLNDVILPTFDTATDEAKARCLYTKGLRYVTNASVGSISACIAYVDAANGSIGLDLMYNDKNMTYTTLGMVNIRNSYVLKAAK